MPTSGHPPAGQQASAEHCLEPQETRARGGGEPSPACWRRRFGSVTRPKPNSRPGRRGAGTGKTRVGGAEPG